MPKLMVPTSPSDRLCAPDGVSAREFDGEWVILDLVGGNYFGLDEVGGVIWERLVMGDTPVDVAERLEREYEQDDASMLCDVLELIDALRAQGLLVLRSKSR